MKKLLVGLLVLGSISAFANTTCLKNGSEQDLCLTIVGTQNSSWFHISYYNFDTDSIRGISRKSICKKLHGNKARSSYTQRVLENVDLACVVK